MWISATFGGQIVSQNGKNEGFKVVYRHTHGILLKTWLIWIFVFFQYALMRMQNINYF